MLAGLWKRLPCRYLFAGSVLRVYPPPGTELGAMEGKTVVQLKEEVPQLLVGQERAGWKFCPLGEEGRSTVWKGSQWALKVAREKMA